MTSTPQDSLVVEKEVRIAAQPSTVFAFLVDPQRMVQWMGTEAAADPTPGGVYRVNITGHDVASGQFVEVVPYSRVVFTWGWEGDGSVVPPGSSTVEFDLSADGDGTLLRLRHSGLPSAEQRQLHGEGWEHYIGRLVVVAAGGDPGPDAMATGPHQ